MRVAAIYDVHGNLPALEAVVEQIRSEEVDLVVVGGDVLPGPMPRESLELLLNLPLPTQFIYGNCEVAALEQLAGREPAGVPEPYRPMMRWSAQQISQYERVLAGWPKTVPMHISGLGKVLFCHGTPRSEDETFTRLTPEDRLLSVFEAADADVVVCGHTHMQFDRTIGKTRVINAGSVGMPFGEPGAYWVLLGPDVQLRRTPYNLAEAADRIARTSYPGAAEFAAHNILQPPTETAMLEAFRG